MYSTDIPWPLVKEQSLRRLQMQNDAKNKCKNVYKRKQWEERKEKVILIPNHTPFATPKWRMIREKSAVKTGNRILSDSDCCWMCWGLLYVRGPWHHGICAFNDWRLVIINDHNWPVVAVKWRGCRDVKTIGIHRTAVCHASLSAMCFGRKNMSTTSICCCQTEHETRCFDVALSFTRNS